MDSFICNILNWKSLILEKNTRNLSNIFFLFINRHNNLQAKKFNFKIINIMVFEWIIPIWLKFWYLYSNSSYDIFSVDLHEYLFCEKPNQNHRYMNVLVRIHCDSIFLICMKDFLWDMISSHAKYITIIMYETIFQDEYILKLFFFDFDANSNLAYNAF
jgi:hypothetical protein